MTPKERAAMQQALEALEEMFHSNSTKVAVEKYNTAHNALLEALAEQTEQSQLADASLEPVAWLIDAVDNEYGGFPFATNHEETVNLCREGVHIVTPLYAAPVRTKDPCNPLQDLTDDEVAKAYMECTGGDIIARCRAVIAADREKNK